MNYAHLRQQCIDWVPANARVLDVGCGDGELMALLQEHRQARTQGIEISPEMVGKAVNRGLAVIQGDADTELADYPDGAFDVAVLSESLQAMKRPRHILHQLGRISPLVIVATPNFSYWRGVLQLLLVGRMPMTRQLPVPWYDTQNIHLCTIRDLFELARLEQFDVEDSVCFDADQRKRSWRSDGLTARLLAPQAAFFLRKRTP